MLPDGDGALILARLRAARSRIPVAVISSIIDEERWATLRRLGADRAFAKPVDPDELLRWIERVAANPSDQTVRPPDDLPGMHLQ
jgi:DNA-binding response OmpR family regulator